MTRYLEIICSTPEILDLVFAIESDQWDLKQIEQWMRRHIFPLK